MHGVDMDKEAQAKLSGTYIFPKTFMHISIYIAYIQKREKVVTRGGNPTRA